MESKIFEIVAKVLAVEPDQVTRELAPKDVEAWDSMRHTMLLLSIEEAFGLSFSDDEMLTVGDVGDLVDLVGAKAAA